MRLAARRSRIAWTLWVVVLAAVQFPRSVLCDQKGTDCLAGYRFYISAAASKDPCSQGTFKLHAFVQFWLKAVDPGASIDATTNPPITLTLSGPGGLHAQATKPLYYFTVAPSMPGLPPGPSGYSLAYFDLGDFQNTKLDRTGDFTVSSSDSSIKAYSFTVVEPELKGLIIDPVAGFRTLAPDEGKDGGDAFIRVAYRTSGDESKQVNVIVSTKESATETGGFYRTEGDKRRPAEIQLGQLIHFRKRFGWLAWWRSGSYFIALAANVDITASATGQVLAAYLEKYPSTLQ